MARYLTESDLRAAGINPRQFGLTTATAAAGGLNRAFLLDIKEDHLEFWMLLRQVESAVESSDGRSARGVAETLPTPGVIGPRRLAELLAGLRDALESYFSLEEFYGCFELAANGDPNNAQLVRRLAGEHQALYQQLDQIVELAEQIAYRETSQRAAEQVRLQFAEFRRQLAEHEAAELELISQQSVLQLGVGD